MNLILMFFRGPFWVQLLLAAAIAAGGYAISIDEANRLAARAALLRQASPATLPVNLAKGAPIGRVPQEVSVSAQVATDYNTRLVRKTNFVITGESFLYVLMSPDAAATDRVVQAAIVLEKDEVDAFADWVTDRITGIGAQGPVVTIDGLRELSAHASHAREAMDENGLLRAADFFFIEPFVQGRAAALAAKPGADGELVMPIYGVAGVMALVGLGKLLWRGRATQTAPAAGALAGPAPVAPRPRRRWTREARQAGIGFVVLLACVLGAAGLFLTEQREFAGMLMVAAIWAFFITVGLVIRLAVVSGWRAVTGPAPQGAPTVAAPPAPRRDLPEWAMVQRAAQAEPAGVVVPQRPRPATDAKHDRFASSPIRSSGGFWSGFGLGRETVAAGSAAAPDDAFRRLDRLVASEKRREATAPRQK